MKAQMSETCSKVTRTVKKRSGKVVKSKHSEECGGDMATYLDTLKHLLPSCEKQLSHGKQSRLEVIQNVIDYIADLQEVLDVDTRTMDLLEYGTKTISLAA